MRKFLLLTIMLVLTGIGAWAQRTVAGRVTDASVATSCSLYRQGAISTTIHEIHVICVFST